MIPAGNVRIWWDTSVQAYRLASPFNKDLVETIKKNIPRSDRSYDEVTKIWTFVERQFGPVQAMMALLGIKPIVITRAQAESATQSSSSPQVRRGTPIAELTLEFCRIVPYDCMIKAYRAAAMQLHPDRNPQSSMDKMSALNAAWERIQKEVYNQ
jgi:hypothetical protein